MDKLKKIWSYLLSPPVKFLIFSYILTVLSIAGALTFVIIDDGTKFAISLLSYLFYALSAITLAYSTYTLIKFLPRIKSSIIAFIKSHKMLNHMMESYDYRTLVFAAFSLTINLLYVAFNGVVAVVELSIWYGALAIYYLLLTGMRFLILFYQGAKRKNQILVDDKVTEVKKYRAVGYLLTFLPIALSFAIFEMVANKKAFVHLGLTVYAVAAYTFFKLTLAIYNIVKSKKSDDVTIVGLITVSLADAGVSLLALQTTLLFTFSNGIDYGYLNAITGAIVCALTILLGISAVINANKKLNEYKGENNG